MGCGGHNHLTVMQFESWLIQAADTEGSKLISVAVSYMYQATTIPLWERHFTGPGEEMMSEDKKIPHALI